MKKEYISKMYKLSKYILLVLLLLSNTVVTDQAGSSESIVGMWSLKKFVTQEQTLYRFEEEVVVVFCEDGAYLTNPLKTPPEEQTNFYKLKGNIISFYDFDPETKEKAEIPYIKNKIINLTENELIIRVSEIDGRPPRAYEVMEYHYVRKKLNTEYKVVLKNCI